MLYGPIAELCVTFFWWLRRACTGPDHVKRYSELGAWLTECYGGSPAAAGPPNAPISNVGTIITIPVAAGVSVDRIVLREDQSVGQRIMGFEVLQGQSASATAAANTTSAKASSDAGFTLLLSGQSIGNRFIGFLPSPVTGPTSLVVNVTSVDGTASDTDDSSTSFLVNSRTLMGSRGFRL